TASFFQIDRALRGSAKPERTRGEVLVVDDEPSICSMVTEILSPMGYTVREAYSGEAALEASKHHGARLGLVLIDVVMPAMDGLTVLNELRKRDPGLEFVLVSGRLNEDTRWLASERGCRFLSKPFNVTELSQLALDVLGPAQERPPG